MMVIVKYFHEKTDKDYEIYNKLWDENSKRFIFLHINLSNEQQMSSIINDLNNNNNKDILAIRFPLIKDIQKNKIITDIISGNAIAYKNNKEWYPNELWIYSPLK